MREKIPKAESASKQQFKKTVADREIKQKKSKLRAKQQEQESQQQMMKAIMI